MFKSTIASVAVALLGSAAMPDMVRAQTDYSFTRIVDTTGVSVYCAGMNSAGTVIVVFLQGLPGVGPELWRGDGTNFTLVAQEVSTLCGSINDSGEIAYGTTSTTSGVAELIRNSNGALTPLASSNEPPFFASTYLPAISATGRVLFHGSGGCSGSAPPPWGIYVAPGGTSVYNCTDFSFDFTSAMSMNDSHVVTFVARDALTGEVGIYRGSGTTPLVAGTTQLRAPLINNSNVVAFWGDINGESALYSTLDGTTTLRVSSPSLSLPAGGPSFSLNDAGTVAYEAVDPSGMGGAIYLGPGPSPVRVVGYGDSLDGTTVTTVRLWPEGLNNAGQVAFFAWLADGREGVYRAEPPDREPPTVTPPTPITVVATQASGATGNGSAAIAAFLAAGAAVDNVDPNPTRLAPQFSGSDATTATVFPIGSNTVTFRFQDTAGNIGSADSTITVTAPPACATSVTSSVAVSVGSARYNKRTRQYTQRVTLRKGTAGSIQGPLSFVLDGLTTGASVVGATGSTTCASPFGSPYVNVNLGSDGVLSKGERINLDLSFQAPVSTAIVYTPRLLAGSGTR